MLKWAVNGPRQTCFQNEDNNLHLPLNSYQQRKHLKRKPTDLTILRPRTSLLDKENQYTSTPLQTSFSSLLESISHQADSLRDISHIMPEPPNNTETTMPVKTPENTKIPKNFPNNYTSTLPTFDVEYSPTALVPGPMLALRGVGIPDSYFKKPRYITPSFQECLQNINEETPLETKLLQNPMEAISKYPAYIEESTLNSAKMGDVTLERMIDAILASNHKSDKSQKHPQQQQHKSSMSPTYTPAEDPANDLQEVWDSEKARYRQRKQKLRDRLTKKVLFNEREICSPFLQENTDPGHLRRQRCLRRKRKINQLTASVVNSTQKLLGKGRQHKTLNMPSNIMQNVIESELKHDKMNPRKLLRNLSPDSGHNSSSDFDEQESDTTLHQCITDDNKTLENTKRRLSFNKI